MKTKKPKKSVWTWWEFEDEKPEPTGYCDWCGTYVGNRKGSKMFLETTVRYKGLKESGKVCDDKCKNLLETDVMNRLKKLDDKFPGFKLDKDE